MRCLAFNFEAVLSGTVLEILNRKLGENCFALNYLKLQLQIPTHLSTYKCLPINSSACTTHGLTLSRAHISIHIEEICLHETSMKFKPARLGGLRKWTDEIAYPFPRNSGQ